ncbi:MAG TPA: HEAT repeat domain-containing protein [Bacteroidota bacterium]|nr:HEAT repeat domain-containing protein [Bacteroidota bacterium]
MNELIEGLHSKDGHVRSRARRGLVSAGREGLPTLIALLTDPNRNVRWEVCKALGEMREPDAAEALTGALDDENIEVRWLAAEALIALRARAVIPMLRALERSFNSLFMRQGAHHVLHALERERLLNSETLAVLDTLRYLEPQISVPLAARRALESIPDSGVSDPRRREAANRKEPVRR